MPSDQIALGRGRQGGESNTAPAPATCGSTGHPGVDGESGMSEVQAKGEAKGSSLSGGRTLSRALRLVLSGPTLSAIWILLCAFYIQTEVGWDVLFQLLQIGRASCRERV